MPRLSSLGAAALCEVELVHQLDCRPARSMPDVDDERVAVVADRVQGSRWADVARVASEAAKRGLYDARTLHNSWHCRPQEGMPPALMPFQERQALRITEAAQRPLTVLPSHREPPVPCSHKPLAGFQFLTCKRKMKSSASSQN